MFFHACTVFVIGFCLCFVFDACTPAVAHAACSDKEFDLILLGPGFSGSLAAIYLGSGILPPDFRWAIAGHTEKDVASAVSEYILEEPRPSKIVVDVTNHTEVSVVARLARVLLDCTSITSELTMSMAIENCAHYVMIGGSASRAAGVDLMADWKNKYQHKAQRNAVAIVQSASFFNWAGADAITAAGAQAVAKDGRGMPDFVRIRALLPAFGNDIPVSNSSWFVPISVNRDFDHKCVCESFPPSTLRLPSTWFNMSANWEECPSQGWSFSPELICVFVVDSLNSQFGAAEIKVETVSNCENYYETSMPNPACFGSANATCHKQIYQTLAKKGKSVVWKAVAGRQLGEDIKTVEVQMEFHGDTYVSASLPSVEVALGLVENAAATGFVQPSAALGVDTLLDRWERIGDGNVFRVKYSIQSKTSKQNDVTVFM